jgi:hypothetical protein
MESILTGNSLNRKLSPQEKYPYVTSSTGYLTWVPCPWTTIHNNYHFYLKLFILQTISTRDHLPRKPSPLETTHFHWKTSSMENISTGNDPAENHFHGKPSPLETMSIRNLLHEVLSQLRQPSFFLNFKNLLVGGDFLLQKSLGLHFNGTGSINSLL